MLIQASGPNGELLRSREGVGSWDDLSVGAQDLAFDNLTCSGFEPTNAPSPAPSAPTKAGCTSSAQYICSDGTPGFATPCDSRKHDVYCADPTHTCTRASASDPTATVDEDGVLTCE